MKDFFAQTIRMPTWVIVVVAAVLLGELINIILGIVRSRKERIANERGQKISDS